MLRRALLVFGMAIVLLLPAVAHSTNHQISISGFQFVPSKLKVNYGDTVTWTNQDEFPHTATSTGGSAKNFNSGTLSNGQSFSIVINPADGKGPFPYVCALHIGMVDTLFVATRHIIAITNFAFQPAGLVINPGDTVVWENWDPIQHTTTSDPGSPKSWDSDLISQSGNFQVVFTAGDGPGPFPYHCTPHPDMKDTIRINPLFCCQGTTGNVNTIGIVDLGDLSLLVAYLTVPAPNKPTLPCSGEANVNATGIIDLGDLSLLVAYLTVPAPNKPALPNCP